MINNKDISHVISKVVSFQSRAGMPNTFCCTHRFHVFLECNADHCTEMFLQNGEKLTLIFPHDSKFFLCQSDHLFAKFCDFCVLKYFLFLPCLFLFLLLFLIFTFITVSYFSLLVTHPVKTLYCCQCILHDQMTFKNLPLMW